MRREEELQQEYEDILFKIMMDRVAQAEGTRLLEENQQLLEQSDAEVPQEIQKHAYKTIRSAFSKRKRSQRVGSLRRGLRVAVIAAILIALMMGVTFAAFPDVRAKVINTIKNVYETHTDFNYSGNNNAPQELGIIVGWVPDGFSVVDEGSVGTCTWKKYVNSEGATIDIQKSFPISSAVDTEDAIVTSISIQGFEATLIEKAGVARVLWLDTEASIVYYVEVEGLSSEVLLEVAETIS